MACAARARAPPRAALRRARASLCSRPLAEPSGSPSARAHARFTRQRNRNAQVSRAAAAHRRYSRRLDVHGHASASWSAAVASHRIRSAPITSLILFPAHALHTQRRPMHAPHSTARRRRFGRAHTAAQNCSSTGVANLIVVPSYLPRAAGQHRAHTRAPHRMHADGKCASYGGAAARVLTHLARSDGT